MKIPNFSFIVALLCFYNTFTTAQPKSMQSKKTYIVRMDKSRMPTAFSDHLQWYDTTLKSVSKSADMAYTYSNVIQGFSTSLAPKEAESLKNQNGVLSVLPDKIYKLHTTRTPKFLGLDKVKAGLPSAGPSSDVIVGVIDTGAWAKSQSFNDSGLGPVPSTWKGQCETGKNFDLSSCNRKLIGARFFTKGYEEHYPINETEESKSPSDDDGHGTHTSTTIAGSPVAGANLFSFANGTARGMVTQARLAIYKTCWGGGSCFTSDVLAAMEVAIEDGVNIISMSLGGLPSAYDEDLIAIGAFSATEHGILVSCAAGNDGPIQESITNGAPWITTVGAGTIDRDFPVYVTLGNGKNLTGTAVYSGVEMADYVPLVYGGDVGKLSHGNFCEPDSLIPEKVAGKIVICDYGGIYPEEKSLAVKNAGGAGMILALTYETEGIQLMVNAHFLPSAEVSKTAAEIIKSYAFSNPKPTAIIASGGTVLGVQPSPQVADFSSRGPNFITPELLKPDIIAPGYNILAGWTGVASPTGLEEDTRRVDYNFLSGTSMSCPHVSGLAALIKSVHQDWSPAAIRSALMTTANSTYEDGGAMLDMSTGKPGTPFDYGAGHVNPVAALDPGLVYNTTMEDYVGFLCASNYNATQIKIITNKDVVCNSTHSLGDFNYPSFSVPFVTGGGSRKKRVKYTRTLTNVGDAGAYRVFVFSQTSMVKIAVEPKLLNFSKPNETKSYTVTFTPTSQPSGTTSFARIEWSDGKHVVGSPIAFMWRKKSKK